MNFKSEDELIVNFTIIIEKAVDSGFGLDDIADAFHIAWEEAVEDIRVKGVKPIQRAIIKE